MVTSHPESKKLTCFRNTPMKFQPEIPEQGHRSKKGFQIFLLTMHFAFILPAFLTTPYPIKNDILIKFLDSLNSIAKLTK